MATPQPQGLPLTFQFPRKITVAEEASEWIEAFEQGFAETYRSIAVKLFHEIRKVDTIAFGAADTAQTVTFDNEEDDADYRIFFSPNWNAATWWTAKTATGFTANASVAPGGGGGNVEYVIVR